MITHSGIKDSGARFQIVPSTRKITVPVAYKVIGTVGDHNSEQLTFQCPKFIDGHDIKGCADHFVTWENANEELGHDHLELVGEDDDYLFYAWTVRGNTTTKAGVVSFSVHFEDYSSDGVLVYRWSTAECRECELLDCVNAALGIYEFIYVDGQTLVIADHTPVRDETLMLETPGVVPEGTKLIYTNGHHDVAGYASAEVAVSTDRPPIISVEDGGIVVATDGTPKNTTTYQLDAPTISVWSNGYVQASVHGMISEHQITSADGGTLVPENIVDGINIFGVVGTHKVELQNVPFTWAITQSADIVNYITIITQGSGMVTNEQITLHAYEEDCAFSGTRMVPVGSIIYLTTLKTGTFTNIKLNDLEILGSYSGCSNHKMLKVTGTEPRFEAELKW